MFCVSNQQTCFVHHTAMEVFYCYGVSIHASAIALGCYIPPVYLKTIFFLKVFLHLNHAETFYSIYGFSSTQDQSMVYALYNLSFLPHHHRSFVQLLAIKVLHLINIWQNFCTTHHHRGLSVHLTTTEIVKSLRKQDPCHFQREVLYIPPWQNFWYISPPSRFLFVNRYF